VAVGIQRKDERHNEKLVDEISEGFNRAVGNKAGEKKAEDEAPKPRFVITGDARATPPSRRRRE
jgi:hypothetical protein